MNGVGTLYAIAIALCLFAAGILGARARRGAQPLFYFVIYLGLESLCFVFELLIAHPLTPLKALWLGLLMSTSLLIAPCLWLAIMEAVEGRRPRPAVLGWRHRLAIAAGVVLTLPLIETAHLGVEFHNPDRIAAPLLEPIVHETMLLCLAIFAVQVPYFLWQCRRVLAKHDLPNPADAQNKSRSWIEVPLIIVCTTWLLGVIRTIMGAASQGGTEFFTYVAFVDVAVAIACVYVFVTRIACMNLPSGSELTSPAAPALPSAAPRYAKSPLDAAVRERIRRKLDAAFDREQIHRDPRLGLGSLSRHINESEHYVSQVINQDLGTTFYELLNAYRIEHAKKLLMTSAGETVLDVALAVGFNAKSTFNSAFRRYTGKTPREFRLSTDAV